ncbi:sigma-54-dependent Fis family transcriptional regulator [Sedimentibacter sp. B4]|uniref:sigma-54 interaction domain-containing protein n=1 Tax=Sedimentibacter sp. B4 TaxID=304766 RepID=UPI00030AEE8E|nr:sigma 54-interacting transcriptional regulator [Sedimentibacter sp. B4]
MDKNNYKYIFQEILKMTDDGFIVVDKLGNVTDINEQYCDFLGRKKEDVVGSSILKVISNSKMIDIVSKKYREEGAIHKFLEGEAKESSNDILLVNRSCVFDEQGDAIAGVAQVKFKLQTLDSAQKLMKEYSELQYYKEEYKKVESNRHSFDIMIGKNKNFIKIKKSAMKFAKTDFPILITGETGTGKEVFAQSIHKNSNRREKTMVSINCAAIPKDLIESELFGYEEGSFTGAKKGGKLGKFELANEGTIFLDEIGDMPYDMQSKLLRVLQENEIEKLGGTKTTKIDVRVIAATRQNLQEMIKQGTFREDLYYRLNVVNIEVSPLRERRDDIVLFANYFLDKLNCKYKSVITISDEALSCLNNYNWPGNIRELENVIKSAFASCENMTIQLNDLPSKMISCNADIDENCSNKKLKNLVNNYEALLIKDALKRNNRNVQDTAEELGIHRSLLYKKMEKYEIL